MPGARTFVWAAAAVVIVACGPSVSTIYEGNIRFEHCYRLDLDPKIARTHREACWREWADRYTYGQTRDRLEYARRRIGAIEVGDPHHPSLDVEADAGAPATSNEAPMPTSINAPPPPTQPTAAPPSAVADAGPGDASAPEPPAMGCTSDCRDTWRTCQSECDPDAGAKRRGCKACDADYRRCVQRCLK